VPRGVHSLASAIAAELYQGEGESFSARRRTTLWGRAMRAPGGDTSICGSADVADRAAAAMRVRVNKPDLASDLLRFLQQRVDVVAAQVTDDELEVSLLGSRRDPYNRIEIDERMQAWQEAHPGVEVEFVDES
jgi:hypothetical protein